MLNNINTAIDTFQSVKSKFVETCVDNEELKKPLNAFITAQTTFAKTVAKSHNDFFTSLYYFVKGLFPIWRLSIRSSFNVGSI